MKHLATLATALLLGTACRSAPESPASHWRVASDLDNPPFAWVDETGVPRGRDVEMALEIAERLEVELQWVRLEFPDLLSALEENRADAVIATLGHTPERAQRVLLSTPYYHTGLLVLVRRGAAEPRELGQLEGKWVSAGAGTTSEKALRERLPLAKQAPASPKGDTSLDRLLGGEVDALIMDGPDALDLVREHPERLLCLSPALAEEHYVIAVRPGANTWLERIDETLEQLHAEGYLVELDRRFELEPGLKVDGR